MISLFFYNFRLQPATSPSGSSGDISQTDESKAQNNATQAEDTNIEDERKQQVPKMPCLADTGDHSYTSVLKTNILCKNKPHFLGEKFN